jgi:hypothetical protein
LLERRPFVAVGFGLAELVHPMTSVMIASSPARYEIRVKRSLMPREHGAYGQLGLPLAVALASGRPSMAAILLAIAAASAFFAHEPVRVVLGHRGTKARRVDGARALHRALLFGAAAVGAGAAGLLLSPPARTAVLGVAPAIAVAVVLAACNADRTTLGEIVASTALAGASVPIAAASCVSVSEALAAWLVWSFGFAMTTLGVRMVTSKSPRERALLPGLVMLLAVAGVAAFARGITIAGAAAPLAAVALVLVLTHPEAKQVRRVGWALMVTVLATGVFLILHARA